MAVCTLCINTLQMKTTNPSSNDSYSQASLNVSFRCLQHSYCDEESVPWHFHGFKRNKSAECISGVPFHTAHGVAQQETRTTEVHTAGI
uniref:Uncharacterized protein n=1 Tax=Rhipicephalus appendiculatus TaxID=34631 RepID=A0A131YDG9_RHIAP